MDQDADLIMLGLATHEVNFHILREEVKPGNQKSVLSGPKPYNFLHLNILREYLAKELHPQQHIPFLWDLERAIDDWVFLIFFVGNDFLPHMPSLEIREDAIERLVNIWKDNLPTYGNYLTDSGIPSLPEVGLFMEQLGDAEDMIFKKRKEG
jgi:5'-3' exoribonuclease 2